MNVRLYLTGALLAVSVLAVAGEDVGFEPHVGALLPMDARLQDESGRAVTLRDATADDPWILAFGYFSCPNLCDTVRADLVGALRELPVDAHYAVAAVSIDPREGIAQVNEARINDAAYDGRAARWHYLRTDARNLAALTRTAGFNARYDESTGQYAHPAGLVFVAPDGRISSYLLGVGYRADAVRRALEEASRGRLLAPPPVAVALLCFDYDASTGRYSLAIVRLLRLVVLLAMVALTGGLIVLFRRPRVAA